jgi:hypothetical protein
LKKPSNARGRGAVREAESPGELTRHFPPLKWLDSVTQQKPAVQEVELWRVTKDTRELRCIVRYMPSGLDLRVMLGGEFRRSELHRDAPIQARANEWRAALLERGWH